MGKRRVDLDGPLLGQVFRTNFKTLIQSLNNKITEQFKSLNSVMPNLRQLVLNNTIESRLKYALATGDWATATRAGMFVLSDKKGVAQVLQRLTYGGYLSHLRRLQAPVSATIKDANVRKYHGTQLGYIDFNETPDGARVGLVKNLSMMCMFSKPENPAMMSLYLKGLLGMKSILDIYPEEIVDGIKVFLNGDLVGIFESGELTVKAVLILKKCKRVGKYLDPITNDELGDFTVTNSIAWYREYKELFIQTDGGRVCRPVYWVANNQLKIENLKWANLDWNGLIRSKAIELIDVSESETSLISFGQDQLRDNKKIEEAHMEFDTLTKAPSNYFRYNYCEIHPIMFLSVISVLIPFSDHNPSPRNNYQSSYKKQALGRYVSNPEHRMDTSAHMLVYAQKPLVYNRASKFTHALDMPQGETAIVAIASYTGYNQEDATIWNKSSFDRGLFNSIYYSTHTNVLESDKNAGITERFDIPAKYDIESFRTESQNYEHLEKTGLSKGVIKLGTQLSGGEVLVGKVMEISDGETSRFLDRSLVADEDTTGIVDKIMPNPDLPYQFNEENEQFVKIRVAQYRKPTIGDKFASEAPQKGICGMLYSQENMPFTEDGIVPDVILNPHAIPSRMTISQIIGCVMNKNAALNGKSYESDPFTTINMEKVMNELEAHGYERHGEEVMYNGMTGEQFKATIFIGPTYYQRLKHMVADKWFSRDDVDNPPVNYRTRQPTEGRRKEGGLRIGEMEAWSLWSHGVSQFIKERMMDSSDLFRMYIDRDSESIIVGNPGKSLYEYDGKKLSEDKVAEIQLPYAMKLFLHELMAQGVDPRMGF
jgi:DNA-directed RNA polymerase II subunit RPB2